MAANTTHVFSIESRFQDAKKRATCSCGWQASGFAGTNRGAYQAWESHMYAMGFRTREAIAAAGKP